MLRDQVDRIFGYDFFISYSHADGSEYPRALADGLIQLGFRVFLDEREYAPGAELRTATRRRVRMSRYLVLLARGGALESRWVLREAEECIRAGRTPLVVDFDRRFEQLGADAPIKQVIGERIAVSEAGSTNVPSEDAFAAIARSFESLRQEQLRARLLGATVVLFAVIAGVAAWQAWVAQQRQQEAEHQARRATASLLAIQSDRMAEESPITALTLAVAAVRGPLDAGQLPPAVAEDALHRRLHDTDGESVSLRYGTLVAVSRGEEWIVTMDDSRRLRAFALDEWGGPPAATIIAPAHEQYHGWDFAISGDGRWLGAYRGKGPLLLADLRGEAAWFSLPIGERAVGRLSFDDRSRWLVAIAHRGPLLVWDLRAPLPAEPITLDGSYWPDREEAAVITPDAHVIAAYAKGLRRWALREDGTIGEPTVLSEERHTLLREAVDGSGRWLVTRRDRDLWLWDLAAPDPREAARVLRDSFRNAFWAAFSPRYVAVASEKSVWLVSLVEGVEPVELPARTSGTSTRSAHRLRFAPRGDWLFASTGDPGGTHLWRLGEGPPSGPKLLPYDEKVGGVLFDLTGLIVSYFDAVRIFKNWSEESNEATYEIRGHDAVATRIFLADRRRTLLTSTSRTLHASPYPPAAHARRLSRHGNEGLASGPGGGLLIGRHQAGFTAWPVAELGASSRAVVGSLRGRPTAPAVDASERFVAVGGSLSDGGEVRIWDLTEKRRGVEGAELATLESAPREVAFSLRGESLAALTEDGKLWIWQTLASTPQPRAEGIESFAWTETDPEPLAFSATGLALPASTATPPLRWDEETRVLAVDPKGRFVVTASDRPAEGANGGLRLWDRASGGGNRLLDERDHERATARFSPGRRWLLAWRNPGGGLSRWDLRRSEPERTLVDLSGDRFESWSQLTFSADGNTLVNPSKRFVHLWRLEQETGEPLVLHGGDDEITAVAVSADGSVVAAADREGALWLWRLEGDAESPAPVHVGDHDGWAESLALEPEGAWLVSSSRRATLHWPLALDRLIGAACARIHGEIDPRRWEQILPGTPYATVCEAERAVANGAGEQRPATGSAAADEPGA